MSESMEKKFFLGAGNRMDEETLCKEYPHAIPGTLTFLQDENKQAVEITCQFVKEDGTKCGCKRQVRTSDLFHTKFCHLHTIINRRQKAKARKAKATLVNISKEQVEEALKAVDNPTPKAEAQAEVKESVETK